MRTILTGSSPHLLEAAIASCPWKITEVVTADMVEASDWARLHGLFCVTHSAWVGQHDVLVKDAPALLLVGEDEKLEQAAKAAGLRIHKFCPELTDEFWI